mmetsp:Transcript_28576/g.27565  ORF Transcript_28576/g.27565 Transcript_28576/m.27565 type:complete len:104 (+) Transcript_28576:368-679(+)
MFSFIPLSLLFQFKRAANIYFLIISILTFMPFSPKSSSSMVGTFVAVLVFTMMKEAYEDYQRYKSDKELNFRRTLVLDEKLDKMNDVFWKDVVLGDIVRVEKD